MQLFTKKEDTTLCNQQSLYSDIHYCHASKLLQDCLGGCLFLYKLVKWLTRHIMGLEFLAAFLSTKTVGC